MEAVVCWVVGVLWHLLLQLDSQFGSAWQQLPRRQSVRAQGERGVWTTNHWLIGLSAVFRSGNWAHTRHSQTHTCPTHTHYELYISYWRSTRSFKQSFVNSKLTSMRKLYDFCLLHVMSSFICCCCGAKWLLLQSMLTGFANTRGI